MEEILELYDLGYNAQYIANKLGFDISVIMNIIGDSEENSDEYDDDNLNKEIAKES